MCISGNLKIILSQIKAIHRMANRAKETLDLLHEEFLRCDICQETITSPKELPCLHSFCLHCLQRMASGAAPGDVLHCPTCRHEITVPSQGVASFPTNFNITRLHDIILERRKARHRKPPVQLVTSLAAMQETIHKAKETRDLLKRRYKDVHRRKQTCVKEIEARREYLVTLVHDYVSRLLVKVDATYDNEMKELNRNLEELEAQIGALQSVGGVGLNDPKCSPIQKLRKQLDKVTCFASNLSTLEETIREVNTTPYADFKPGIASSYVMEQVVGRLHMTSQADLDAEKADRRASLANIPEHDTTSVLNYFSCSTPDDDVECYVTDVTVLSSGEIVCVDADNHCAKIFFASGQPKLTFGKRILKRPDKVTSLDDRSRRHVPGTSSARTSRIRILITDLEEEAIVQFDQHGTLLTRFPSPVNNPTAICATRDDNVVISDWKTKTVHIVSESGEHLHTFPTDMSWPVYLCACPNGNIVVSDWKSHHVRVFDTFGTRIRDYNDVGTGDSQLHRPNGVACDRNNRVYVTDMKNCRVHLLTESGEFVRFVATSEHGIRRPTGVTLGNNGELLVADLKGTISVLTLGGHD